MFDTAMDNAEQKKHSSVIKYSYAGKKAANTSFQKLEEAIRLEDIGKASSEDIREQTGWFRIEKKRHTASEQSVLRDSKVQQRVCK